MSTIRERAEQALARAEGATPGPWSVDPISDVYVRHGERGEHGPSIRALNLGDAPFIAAARSDVPDLARFVLRVTAPEMRKALADVFCAVVLRRPPGSLPELAEALADAALAALLTDGPEAQS